MWILGVVLIGFIIGTVARFVVPGPNPANFFVTALLGVVGSVVATLIGQAGGLYAPGEPAGFLASIVGAVLVLLLYRGIQRKSDTKPIKTLP